MKERKKEVCEFSFSLGHGGVSTIEGPLGRPSKASKRERIFVRSRTK